MTLSFPDFNPAKTLYKVNCNLQPLPPGYPISAKVIADSLSWYGKRLVTLQLVFPRYILAELNTHRAFSRNTSSSRAIPTNKLITNSEELFVEPCRYGKNKKGMQADSINLSGDDLEEARAIWKHMAEICRQGSARLAELGLHKQWASRPIEWFSTVKVILTATEFDNFFFLRDHVDAQDEIAHLAQAMKIALNESTPKQLSLHDWHLPFINEKELQELGIIDALKVSSARCARTSFKTFHGITSTLEEDKELYTKLVHGGISDENPFHASPTEHQATSEVVKGESDWPAWRSNFVGWIQHRKVIENNAHSKLGL